MDEPQTQADQIAAMAREPRSPERDERLVHLLLGVRTIGGALVCADESLLDVRVRDAIREQLLSTPSYAPPAVRGAPARVVAPAFELDAPVSVEVGAE